MATPKVGVILSTTREGRFGDMPSEWILGIASQRDDLDLEIIDLRDYPLGFFGDDERTESSGAREAGRRWSANIASLDGFIFITAEYNHGIPGVLKNALDHAYQEYHRKPAAFIGYGGVGGARAVQQLRLICCELQIVPLRSAVHIGMDIMGAIRAGERELAEYDHLLTRAGEMLDELAWWTTTLRAGRRELDAERRASVRTSATVAS